jgi:catechol-2,3-dioxygenase
MSFKVQRLDHAVLYCSDIERSKQFYCGVLGMQIVTDAMGVYLLRAGSNEQHHDLGLFPAHHGGRAQRGGPGLYHLAWKVNRIEDLAEAKTALQQAGALTGTSSHGATKSLYGVDPDGNEFEITYTIPRAHWGEWETGGTVEPLNLSAELQKYGGAFERKEI